MEDNGDERLKGFVTGCPCWLVSRFQGEEKVCGCENLLGINSACRREKIGHKLPIYSCQSFVNQTGLPVRKRKVKLCSKKPFHL